MEFCKQFNARTQDKAGKILYVIITYYADKSFDFVIKTHSRCYSIVRVAKVKVVLLSLTVRKLPRLLGNRFVRLLKDKMVDLNCFTVEVAMKMALPVHS